ncbi:MAG: LysR family transcriptional regulator [Rhizobiaceae bacterium]|nr:LysR family transcriptional regulator [Rhizobiaceae bacterium]
MQTRALQTLVRVSTLGSFAKVAKEMNTTISTVSMQVRSVEEQLGLELFDRAHRPPKLTPIGRQVCERAGDLLSAENRLLALSNRDGELAGNFRIGFVATASVRLLPGFLENARQSASGASFELETALSEVLEERVQSGLLDAAVVTESQESKAGLEYHVLRTEALKFAIPKHYAGMRVSELRTELPFIQFNPGSGIGKLIERFMSDFSSERAKQDIVLESVEAIVECVNRGMGFTLLSEPDIVRYASKACSIVPVNSQALERHLSLVVRSRAFSASSRDQLIRLFE